MSHPGDALAARFEHDSVRVRLPTRDSEAWAPRVSRLPRVFVPLAFFALLAPSLREMLAAVFYHSTLPEGFRDLVIDLLIRIPLTPTLWTSSGILLLGALIAFYSAHVVTHIHLDIDGDDLVVRRVGGRVRERRIPMRSIQACHLTNGTLRIVLDEEDVSVRLDRVPEDSAAWLCDAIQATMEQARARGGVPNPELLDLLPASRRAVQ